jgi:Endonuclease-reverse transcriptase
MDANGDTFSVDRLRALEIDATTLTIITGDWNLHHPLYRQMSSPGCQPDEHAETTVEWLTTNTFKLENKWNQETWHAFGTNSTSALDFTFKNATATEAHVLQNWLIEHEENTRSNHYATFFSIANSNNVLYDLTEAKYNWKDMDGPAFTKELKAVLHEDEDWYNRVFGPLFDHSIHPVMAQILDMAMEALQKCMTKVAEKAAPLRHPCA